MIEPADGGSKTGLTHQRRAEGNTDTGGVPQVKVLQLRGCSCGGQSTGGYDGGDGAVVQVGIMILRAWLRFIRVQAPLECIYLDGKTRRLYIT